MAQPPAYNRDTDFARNAGSNTDHNALNAELDRASNSINDIRQNLALLQADDGRLRSALVTYDAMNPGLLQEIAAGIRADVVGYLAHIEAAASRAEAAVESAAGSVVLANQYRESAALYKYQAQLESESAAASAQAAQDILEDIRASAVG